MTTLKELQKQLVEFEKLAWDAPADEAGKFRHITLHLGKLLGKISTVAERREHRLDPDLVQIKEEVIPDLLYYALCLADLYDVDLEEAFIKRLQANEVRVADWVDKRDT